MRNKKADSKSSFKNNSFQNNVLKTFLVDKDYQLLDFLLEKFSNQSRNNVKNILSKKCVLVDGVVTSRFDYKLTRKNVVTILKRGLKVDKNDNSIKLDIIYEDNDFIVINKPSGLLSIADDKENSKTAYRYVLEYVRKTNPKNQIYVVHRIDKDTSGVLMFAKDKELRDLLQDSWNNIVSKREYYAIISGVMDPLNGTIKSYLTETKTHMVFSSKGKNGKLAITNYETVKENKKYSLLKVNIDSGRKNQIRVHLAESSHPIVNDDKYNGEKTRLNRLGLHASKLFFTNPLNHKEYKFIAKLPSDINNFI